MMILVKVLNCQRGHKKTRTTIMVAIGVDESEEDNEESMWSVC